jgi:hypothetical protein
MLRASALRATAERPDDASMNTEESLLTSSLSSIGLQAAPIERPSDHSASVLVPVQVDMTLRIDVAAEPSRRATTTIEERTLAGRTVTTLRYVDGSGERDRFRCGTLTYEVWDVADIQASPYGFLDNADFLTQLIGQLRCPS